MARFKRGQSGNPGGRPKTVALVRNGCAKLLPKALRKLEELLESRDDKVALAACKEIIEQAAGRAPQSLEMESAMKRKVAAETALAELKTKMLAEGIDPDAAAVINVIIPETLRSDGDA